MHEYDAKSFIFYLGPILAKDTQNVTHTEEKLDSISISSTRGSPSSPPTICPLASLTPAMM